jgi:hypothetical protein
MNDWFKNKMIYITKNILILILLIKLVLILNNKGLSLKWYLLRINK